MTTVDSATQVPHQLADIEIIIPDPVSYPALPPYAVKLNDWPHLQTRLRR